MKDLIRKTCNKEAVVSLDGTNFNFPYARYCNGSFNYRGKKGGIIWAGESIATVFPLKDLTQDLLLEFYGINGDHLDSPILEIVFNGNLLVRHVSPFEHMYSWGKDIPEEWRTFYCIIPHCLLKADNTLQVLNLGPDYIILAKVNAWAAGKDVSRESFLPAKKSEKTIQAFKAELMPQIDGELNEQGWRDAPLVYLGSEDENQTEARVLYDETNLYVGFKSYDAQMTEIIKDGPHAKLLDTCVQVLLNTDIENNNEYYSFTLNADGNKYAKKSTSDFPEKLSWEAKCKIGSSFWTAEFAIPYRILDNIKEQFYQYDSFSRVFFPAGYIWRVNFVRKRFSQFKFYDCYSWAEFIDPVMGTRIDSLTTKRHVGLPFHHFYQPANFGLLSGLRVNFKTENYSPMELEIDRPLLGENYFPGKIKKNYPLEKAINLIAEVKRPKHTSSVLSLSLPYRMDRESAFKLPCPIVKSGRQDFVVSLLSNDTNRTIVARRSYQLDVPDPFRATLDRSYYTDEDNAFLDVSFRVRKPILQKAKLTAEVIDEREPSIVLLNKYESLATDSGTLRMPLDISKLSAGNYKIICRMSGAKGEPLGHQMLTLDKYRKKENEVKIRSDGMLLVDGRPFYPYGVYSQGEESLEEIRTIGFNTVAPGFDAASNLVSYLDRAHSLGLKVVNSRGLYSSIARTETDFTGLETAVKLQRDHPAYLCYYLIDEPDSLHSQNATGDNLFTVTQFIKNLDPYHPTFITLSTVGHITYHANGTMSLGDAVDIIAPDPYPIPGNPNAVAYEVKNVVAGLKNRKAVPWIIQQSFEKGAPGRGPTAEETRLMAYLAIIHGAKGILYFTHEHMRKLPCYPDIYRQTAKEIKFLNPIIAAPSSQKTVLIQPETADTLLKEHDGKLYLMAVNTEKDEREFKFILPEIGNTKGIVKVLFEDREISHIQGSFIDKFIGYGVHVYQID